MGLFCVSSLESAMLPDTAPFLCERVNVQVSHIHLHLHTKRLTHLRLPIDSLVLICIVLICIVESLSATGTAQSQEGTLKVVKIVGKPKKEIPDPCAGPPPTAQGLVWPPCLPRSVVGLLEAQERLLWVQEHQMTQSLRN